MADLEKVRATLIKVSIGKTGENKKWDPHTINCGGLRRFTPTEVEVWFHAQREGEKHHAVLPVPWSGMCEGGHCRIRSVSFINGQVTVDTDYQIHDQDAVISAQLSAPIP